MKAIERFYFVNDLRDKFFSAYGGITSEQLEWTPEGSKNSIGFLLRHIAQAEDWFLQTVILGENMTPKRRKELQDIDSILDYLNETRGRTLAYLQENPITVLDETRTIPSEGFRGEPIENPSIGWIIHRVFDHEVYHLGQVNALLRLQGIDPPNM
ncbi:DinB family protein [Bacillus dakarensis]|uniref:DinB family protein n=1 Tax=Robertmurraya dakarensis TaxID=1926278 RepID=UPI000981D90F|nr:DinB family protein [Bacillus dakarensis]